MIGQQGLLLDHIRGILELLHGLVSEGRVSY